MARYGKKAQSKVKRAMHERKRGTLRSGRSGKRVTSRKQAIAIGLSEARRAGGKVPSRSSRGRSRSRTRSSSRSRSRSSLAKAGAGERRNVGLLAVASRIVRTARLALEKGALLDGQRLMEDVTLDVAG